MMHRVMRTFARLGLPALVLSVAVAACDDTPTDGDMADGQGQMSVYLTDHPGDVDSVWVQVNDVELVGEDVTVSLLEEPTGLINLIQLQDSATALAEGVTVDAGTYTQVRFILGSGVLQSSDGGVHVFGGAEHPNGMDATGSLLCPSCVQSGIKVRLPGGVEIAEGDDAGLLMDFDVSQSFGHQAGQSGRWVMHPVILGLAADPGAIEGDDAESTISGTVNLATDVTIPTCGGEERTLEEFVPRASATTLTDDEDNPLEFSGETEEDGMFEIEVLGVDTYTLGYQAETTFDAEKLVWTADVDEPASGEVTIDAEGSEVDGVVYTISDVACEPTS